MASPTDRLLSAIRRWSSESGKPDHSLVHWAQLYLGWPYPNVGVNPQLENMTPVERARRSVGEHFGHPTLDQLEDRIQKLTGLGIWEPFLVSSVSRCIADQMDQLADAAVMAERRERSRRDLDEFAANEDARREWMAAVREKQIDEGIPLDDLATDSSVDEFVRDMKRKLQAIPDEEMAERQRDAQSWRRLASDLIDFTSESSRALTAGE